MNGRFGCSHAAYMRPITEPVVPCGKAEFRERKPFHWPPKVAEDIQ